MLLRNRVRHITALTLLTLLTAAAPAFAQDKTYTIDTLAGAGVADGGLATDAFLANVTAVEYDARGALFIADGNRVRRVSAGIIRTIGGGDLEPRLVDGGSPTEGHLAWPNALAIGHGQVYVAEQQTCTIWALGDRAQRVAGSGDEQGSGCGDMGDGGPATDARLAGISELEVDRDGALLVVANCRIRRIDPATGVIDSLTAPGGCVTGIEVEREGDLWINAGCEISRLSRTTGTTTPVASGAGCGRVEADAGGELFVDDGTAIRRIDSTTHEVTLAAGNGAECGWRVPVGVPATERPKCGPFSVDPFGTLAYGEWVRVIGARDGTTSVLAGTGDFWGGDGIAARKSRLQGFNGPSDIARGASGKLYIAEGCRIRVIAPDNVIRLYAGRDCARDYSSSGDGGPAAAATLSQASALAITPREDIYVADGCRIRRIDGRTDVITTVATLDCGFVDDLVLSEDNRALFFADQANCRLLRLDLASEAITPFAASETCGYIGSIGRGPDGSVLFSDGCRLLSASRTGVVSTVAGTGECRGETVEGPATQSPIRSVSAITSANGEVFFADFAAVWRIDKSGRMSRIAGQASGPIQALRDQGKGDGGPARDALLGWVRDLEPGAGKSLYVLSLKYENRIRVLR